MARARRIWPWLALGSVAVLFASCYGAVWIVRAGARVRPVAPRAFFDQPPRVLNIAHRGASGHEREHTFAAYDRALAEGADVLELDVRRTADGEAVIVHDGTVAGGAKVGASTLAELRSAGRGDELPTLGDVFERYPGVRMNIEIKGDDLALADTVADLIERYGRGDRVVVASFHAAPLRRLRARTAGAVATSASATEALRFYACYTLEIPCRPDYAVLQLPVRVAGGRIDLADPDFVSYAHGHGLPVHFWTVDDPDVMRRLVAVGADGIMTNFPDRARRVIRAAGSLQ